MKATKKQRQLLKKVVVDGMNIGDAAMEVYDCKNQASAASVGSQAMKALEKKGLVENAYAKYGLDEELIISSLAEDIKAKPKNRKPELELAAKLTGMLTDKKEVKHTGKMGIEALLGEVDELDDAGVSE